MLCFDNAVDCEGEIPLCMVLKEIFILSWELNIPMLWLLPVANSLFCEDLVTTLGIYRSSLFMQMWRIILVFSLFLLSVDTV